MAIRRIVFLDIDGVLNSDTWDAHVRVGLADRPIVDGEPVPIDPDAVDRLNLLVEPGVEFILSSAWRHLGLDVVGRMLRVVGFTSSLSGATPIQTHRLSISADYRPGRGVSRTRGQDIKAWLDDHRIGPTSWGRDVRFACLDDDCDMDPVRDHWVECSELDGLTMDGVAAARALLGLRPITGR